MRSSQVNQTTPSRFQRVRVLAEQRERLGQQIGLALEPLLERVLARPGRPAELGDPQPHDVVCRALRLAQRPADLHLHLVDPLRVGVQRDRVELVLDPGDRVHLAQELRLRDLGRSEHPGEQDLGVGVGGVDRVRGKPDQVGVFLGVGVGVEVLLAVGLVPDLPLLDRVGDALVRRVGEVGLPEGSVRPVAANGGVDEVLPAGARLAVQRRLRGLPVDVAGDVGEDRQDPRPRLRGVADLRVEVHPVADPVRGPRLAVAGRGLHVRPVHRDRTTSAPALSILS